MNNLGTKELKGTKFILRKFRSNDYKAMFFNYCHDDKVAKYVSRNKHSTIKETEEILNKRFLNYGNQTYRWAIESVSTNEVIGSIDVVSFDEKNEVAEIGYCLSSKFWNQGIMSEALKLVSNYLLNEVMLNTLIIKVFQENIASQKVALHNGFIKFSEEKKIIKDKEITLYCYKLTK